MPKCSRMACRVEIDGPHCAIWNDFSVSTPRLYCVSCGRKIIEPNKKYDELKLKHEFRDSVTPPEVV